MIAAWRAFVESLDTPGGHILVMSGLVALGIFAVRAGFPDGKELVVGGTAALLAVLRTGSHNRAI